MTHPRVADDIRRSPHQDTRKPGHAPPAGEPKSAQKLLADADREMRRAEAAMVTAQSNAARRAAIAAAEDALDKARRSGVDQAALVPLEQALAKLKRDADRLPLELAEAAVRAAADARVAGNTVLAEVLERRARWLRDGSYAGVPYFDGSDLDRRTPVIGRPSDTDPEMPGLRDWEDEYLARTAGDRDLRDIPTAGGLTYLYDTTTAPADDEAVNRVVAVWGRSGAPLGPRDAVRMAGFPSPNGKGPKPLDRGHLAGRSFGGGEDLNLIPQDAGLNQGRTEEGRVWRQLERELTENPGTAFFVRPIYGDNSDFPTHIEFGVQQPDGAWRSHMFNNR